MSILVTGATGYIGRGVADALVAGGHRVIGLARSAEAAARLRERGIDPAIGDLDDAEGLAAICGRCNGVVHLAFGWKADVSSTISAERQAVVAMLRALAGTGRPFIFPSGTSVLGDTGRTVPDEEAAIAPHPLDERLRTERLVLEAGGGGARRRDPGPQRLRPRRRPSAVRRAARCRRGPRRHPLFARLGRQSLVLCPRRRLGRSVRPGAGARRAGPAISRRQSRLRTRNIAVALSRGTGWEGRTRELPHAELRPLFPVAALADYWSQNGQSSREKAERLLGWQPRHLDLLREIASPCRLS